MLKIAPSILSADFANLALALDQCRSGEADYVHVDVMDGHFVPNLTIGPAVVRDLNKRTDIPLDVHLMIENPDAYIEAFAKAGSHMITVHVEACSNLHRTLKLIKSQGVKAGISLKPATSLSTIKSVLDIIDLALIMSVNPGFGGQAFIPDSLIKINTLNDLLHERGLRKNVEIEVDGGIKLDNALTVLDAGADVLVAGSAIFDTKDPAETIRQFRSLSD